MIELNIQVVNIFFSADSGFVSFKAKVQDTSEEITAVGTITGNNLMHGDKLAVRGTWTNHPTYGKQFQIQQWKFLETDRTLSHFKTFLTSGAVRGIGPAMAEKIFKKFGADTPRIFNEDIDQLKKIEGIGVKVFKSIIQSWDKVKNHHFLYGLGISGKQVQKIIDQYGHEAENKIRENPYILAEDIEGIGFVRADQIANSLGIEKDSPFRIKSALKYALMESSNNGHCYLPEKNLIFETQELLQLDKGLIAQTLEHSIKSFELIKVGDLVGSRLVVNTEKSIALKLRRLSGPATILDANEIEQDCVDLSPFELDPLQVNAIKTALTNRVSVITGFPGSGKSLCTKTIVNILDKHRISFQLLAPTGRASKRLSEVTGYPASTIHRFLLKLKHRRGEIRMNDNFLDDDPYIDKYNDRDYTVFIVDESSMIDVFLLRSLMEEINHHVIFIGDIDQLPPVGPGNTLRDIIDSQMFPVIKLTKIFRQEEGSDILKAAFTVNNGEVPEFVDFTKKKAECSLLALRDPEKTCEALTKVVTEVFPKHYPHLDIKSDVQILSPYNKGLLGSIHLNKVLQELLNPEVNVKDIKNYIEFGPNRFFLDDKVIQTANNYDKNVFNGDVGIITKIYPEYDECIVQFPHTVVSYTAAELVDLKLAYVISVHKSQGSECPAIILILHNSHYNLLQKNLLYTGITRAQKLLIVISTYDVLDTAVKNDKVQSRYTLLKERIRDEIPDSILV